LFRSVGVGGSARCAQQGGVILKNPGDVGVVRAKDFLVDREGLFQQRDGIGKFGLRDQSLRPMNKRPRQPRIVVAEGTRRHDGRHELAVGLTEPPLVQGLSPRLIGAPPLVVRDPNA